MAKVNKKYEIWFLTGSQSLYGEETLKQVAEQSKAVLEQLQKNVSAPVEFVWKPVLKTPDAIRRQMLDASARTAQEAADGLGVQLGQIAKSVIFRRLRDAVAVLVVTSGDRRVDESKVAALVGPVGRADAEFVKARTGFAIGGVAPLAHVQPTVTLLDRELWRFETLWAAAGHPHAVFQLQPEDLRRLTGAPVADVVVSS